MNFLFVDKILKTEPAQSIVGIKQVTAEDSYLETNAQGQVVLMPCIVGEALGQLAAWNVMAANGFTQRPVAGVIGLVKKYDDVQVGETLLLESFIDEVDEEAVRYHSVATVNGRRILTLENALGPFLPMHEFIDIEIVKHQYQSILHEGPLPETKEAKFELATYNLQQLNAISIQFNRIVEWESGQHVVAEKLVTQVAPYFVDHFPKKPVFPLSLLMQCKLRLATEFLVESFGAERIESVKTISIRKVKMNKFAKPGDCIDSTIMLRHADEQQILLRFRSEIQGKRACLGEIVFES